MSSDLETRLREGLTPEVLERMALDAWNHRDDRFFDGEFLREAIVAALLPLLEAREAAIRSEGQTCATCQHFIAIGYHGACGEGVQSDEEGFIECDFYCNKWLPASPRPEGR